MLALCDNLWDAKDIVRAYARREEGSLTIVCRYGDHRQDLVKEAWDSATEGDFLTMSHDKVSSSTHIHRGERVVSFTAIAPDFLGEEPTGDLLLCDVDFDWHTKLKSDVVAAAYEKEPNGHLHQQHQ